MLCAYLAAGVLVSLALNAAFGLWWADPAVALAIAGLAIKEGHQTWQGEGCCATRPSTTQTTPTATTTAGADLRLRSDPRPDACFHNAHAPAEQAIGKQLRRACWIASTRQIGAPPVMRGSVALGYSPGAALRALPSAQSGRNRRRQDARAGCEAGLSPSHCS